MSNNHSTEESMIALAALLQSCLVVERIATGKPLNDEVIKSLKNSLFVFDAPHALDIYGDLSHLADGLQCLKKLLSKEEPVNTDNAIRYAVSIISLERSFSKNDSMLSIVSSRLNHISNQQAFFQHDDNNLYSAVAELYKDTISQLQFKIQVKGDMNILQQPQNAEKIRTFLFCAVRAAVLWHQLGGRRWHLLLRRQSLLKVANRLLEKTKK